MGAPMSDATKPVHCNKHGETPATFVCRHVLSGVACGFHHSSDDPDDRWPDAWCDRCEAAFERDGAWNDANDPDISLMCTGCYELARERNEYLPPPLEAGQLAVSTDEFAALAYEACERCTVRQDAARDAWEKFASGKRWHFDAETDTIRFFDSPTGETVVADVTITGSFSKKSDTWLWAWANQNYAESARAAMNPVRVFGEVRGIEQFQNGHWSAEEVDAWEVTQIAADLLGASAIYCAPMEHMLVFMLLDNFQLVYPA